MAVKTFVVKALLTPLPPQMRSASQPVKVQIGGACAGPPEMRTLTCFLAAVRKDGELGFPASISLSTTSTTVFLRASASLTPLIFEKSVCEKNVVALSLALVLVGLVFLGD